jgi:hypothetical protein
MDLRVRFPDDAVEDPRSLAIDLYARLAGHDDAADMSPVMRAFLDVSWADMWIGNGGFIGLWQGSAAKIRRLPSAAERVEAPAFAALFQDANESLPAGALESDAALQGFLDENHDEAFDELVEALFDRYFAAGDLADALGRFVLAHREEFFTDDAAVR